MTALSKLFRQTFVYGLATVLPRMLSFLLVPLYTAVLPVEGYGEVSVIFAWIILFNVLLAYGMETAFFRFFHRENDKSPVVSTSAVSLIGSSLLFLTVAWLLKGQLAALSGVAERFVGFTLFVLVLDALAIIPFAWLRAVEKPGRYTFIKIANVALNLSLNLFFLIWLPKLAESGSSFFGRMYVENFELSYIFISMIIASAATLLMVSPFYTSISYRFDARMWKDMLRYAWPVLVAGLAFAVITAMDRILLEQLLPESTARYQVGTYAACIKLAVFMTLFATAFRLGVEPFFFSKAEEKDAPETYALITRFFVATGTIILLGVVVFSDLLKQLLIRDEAYWEAMVVVPVILLANLFLGIYHNLSVWYKVTDKTIYGAVISGIASLVFLGLNFWLIPEMSYRGSAIAILAAYSFMMCSSYLLGRRRYPVPYDLKRIGIYLTLSIAFSGLAFYGLDRNLLAGTGLLVLFLLIVLSLEKNTLKKLINGLA